MPPYLMPRLAIRLVHTVALASLLCGAAPVLADPPDWSIEPTDWADYMPVTGRLDLGGVATQTPGTLVAAFVEDELRGVAEIDLTHVETLGPLFFLQAWSNAAHGETVTFRAYDPETDAVLPITETLPLDTSVPVGTPAAPFVWTAEPGNTPPDWEVDPADFEFFMGVTGTVHVDGAPISAVPGHLVAAFVGGELRGVAEVDLSVAELYGPLFFLSVRSNLAAGETVTFEVWDATQGTVLAIAETVSFQHQATQGTVPDPFVWNASGARSVTLTGQEGWRLLAAPATDATIGDLLGPIWTQGFPGADSESGAPNVYTWDEATGWQPASGQHALIGSGRGLAVYTYADADLADPVPDGFPHLLQVSGTGPPVPFDFGLTYADTETTDPGWHLVGNPFDTSLDWDHAGWTRTNVSQAIYVWDPNLGSGAYRSWNGSVGDLGSGVIAPFQGFWVQAMAENPLLVVPAEAVAEGGTFYGRSATAEAPAIRFQVEGVLEAMPQIASAYILLTDEAAPGLDPLDAHELTSLAPTTLALFSQTDRPDADPLNLDINALPPLTRDALDIPLAVQATGPAPGQVPLVLSWTLHNLPADWTLTLTDTEADLTLDLRAATEYPFNLGTAPAPRTGHAGSPPPPAPLQRSDPARFQLHLTPAAPTSTANAATPEPAVLEPVFPNPFSTTASVRFRLGAPGHVRLAAYDVLGREVAVLMDAWHPPGAGETRFDGRNLPSGTYLLRLEAGDSVQVQRVTRVR